MSESQNCFARGRLHMRNSLKKHKKLYSPLSFLYKIYYSTSGNLHVLPDYLIIGAAKSGTSSLYEYLIQHPNIEPALGKEINFFDMNYSRGNNWYRSYFPFSMQKKFEKVFSKTPFITGEATPRYLDYPHCPSRVKNLIPDVKLVVLLRNPIDRAYSHWNMMVSHKRENLSFENAIEEESNRISGEYDKMNNDEAFYSRNYFWYGYLDRSIYVNKIKNWLKFFSLDQIIFLKSEDFFNDTQTTYSKVLNFLDESPHNLTRYNTFRKGSYKSKKMEQSTRNKLLKFFKPYNEQLNQLINCDMEWNE